MKRVFKFFLVCILLPVNVWAAQLPPGSAIASANAYATQAGMRILRQGGNAFDAAVAVSSTLAVVSPYHSGLGGGGFWLLFDAKKKAYHALDSREVAPLAATKDMFLDLDKNPIPNASLDGPLSAAIPGEPAAMAYLVEHFGQLSLAQDLAPAIELAEKGFPLDQQFIDMLNMPSRLIALNEYPSSKKIFTDKGKIPKVGSLLVQKDLAQTLRIFAKKGHDGFYKGDVAKKLVDAVKKSGGIWQLNDLANYQVKLRKPLMGQYQGIRVITMPPPSAGGISILTMLNVLAFYQLQEQTMLKQIHYVVEAMRLAFWDRANYLGDPDFVDVPVKKLISTEHAAYLRRFIHPDHATPSVELPPTVGFDEKKNTTHFSIIDSQGNRVAATLSVNYIFGSSFVAEGTGVLLNDHMDDFSTKPGVKNVFGLIGNEENEIAPGKRPVSSMSPTFLESPRRVAILGTPGGSRIPTMVLLGILKFAEHKGVISMVSALRYHHQYRPDLLQFEPGTFNPSLQHQLVEMGYRLKPLRDYYGDMQAVVWNKFNNTLFAASDPRHIGLASVDSMVQIKGYGYAH